MPSDIFLDVLVNYGYVHIDVNAAIHNVRLVDGSNASASMGLSVMEGVASNALRSIPGNQLDGLHDTVDNL